MLWQKALGLSLALYLLAVWALYCRRLALEQRRQAEQRRRDADVARGATV